MGRGWWCCNVNAKMLSLYSPYLLLVVKGSCYTSCLSVLNISCLEGSILSFSIYLLLKLKRKFLYKLEEEEKDMNIPLAEFSADKHEYMVGFS